MCLVAFKSVRFLPFRYSWNCNLLCKLRVCVITLSPEHHILKQNKKVVNINYQVSSDTNRLENKVSGKWKKVLLIISFAFHFIPLLLPTRVAKKLNQHLFYVKLNAVMEVIMTCCHASMAPLSKWTKSCWGTVIYSLHRLEARKKPRTSCTYNFKLSFFSSLGVMVILALYFPIEANRFRKMRNCCQQ